MTWPSAAVQSATSGSSSSQVAAAASRMSSARCFSNEPRSSQSTCMWTTTAEQAARLSCSLGHLLHVVSSFAEFGTYLSTSEICSDWSATRKNFSR